jgi:hypothetical protein
MNCRHGFIVLGLQASKVNISVVEMGERDGEVRIISYCISQFLFGKCQGGSSEVFVLVLGDCLCFFFIKTEHCVEMMCSTA